MNKLMRKRFAKIIAPLVPAIAFVYSTYDPRGYVILFWYIFYLLYSATFSYLSFFLLGLPVMNYLERKNLYNVISILIAGAITGILAMLMIAMIFGLMLGSLRAENVFTIEACYLGSISGMSVSFTYWIINDLTIGKLKHILSNS